MFNTRIPIYGIIILLSLIANIIIIIINSKKTKLINREIICLILYENVGIIGGAKILTFLQNYKELNGEFNFLRLGLSSYGAIIGGLLFLILFSVQFKKSLKEILYIFWPSIPLMYSIGKIGCFLVGCCHGIEYNGIGRIMYKYSVVAPKGVYLFPVQLVESILFFIIFIYIIKLYINDKFKTTNFGLSIILCGLVKFCLDFFRISHIDITLSLNQIISIFFIIIGSIIIIKNKKRKT